MSEQTAREELVARAICVAQGSDPEADWSEPKPNLLNPPRLLAWETYLPEARAALAALRPTEAQARAEVLEAQVNELKGEVAWEAGLHASALQRAVKVAEDWASRDDLEGRHIGAKIAEAIRALSTSAKEPSS